MYVCDSLSDVELDVAGPRGTGETAYNVEQCRCPPNYVGSSCERCADGYYRSKEGPYLGTCVPCQCNNRADSCDPDSGACIVSINLFTYLLIYLLTSQCKALTLGLVYHVLIYLLTYSLFACLFSSYSNRGHRVVDLNWVVSSIARVSISLWVR